MTYRVLCLALAGFASFGCAGGGSTTTAPPTPDPNCPSKTITDSQATLVSPPPGATGVSPAIGSITLAYGIAASTFAIGLTAPDGSGVSTQAVNPPPGPVTVTVQIGQLKPGTTYTVQGNNGPNFAHLLCWTTVNATFGSFTTR